MKGQLLIKHLLLFFSGLIIAIMIIFSVNIIAFHIFRKGFLNAKLASETLASIISAISSSTFNITYTLTIPSDCIINITNNNITLEFNGEAYTSPIVRPSYVTIINESVSCKKGYLTIRKINNKVIIK